MSNAFRVFTLFPSAGFDDPLDGFIRTGAWSSSLYIAISYVWGNPTAYAHIHIGDRTLPVTRNLEAVLRNLRKISEPIELWVDAICINQSNVPERNAQVQDMANIYKAAEEVIGWIGELNPEAPIGFRIFREITARHRNEGFDDFLDAYIRDVSNDPSWEALLELLDRPYWTRLWILQEVSVNLQVSLRFGSDPENMIKVQDLFEWDTIRFEIVAKWRTHRRSHTEESFIQRFDSVLNNVYNAAFVPSLYPLTLEEFQPFLLSLLCGGPLCSCPQDFIFGVVGLFSRSPVTVDYGISPRELFLAVLKSYQNHTQKLDFLSWAWINQSSPNSTYTNTYDLPTWAVDWAWRERFVSPIPLANSKEDQRILWDTIYAASGASKYRATNTTDPDILNLRGCRVATIEILGTLAESSVSTLWPKDWSSIAHFGNYEPPLKNASRRANQPELKIWHASQSSEKRLSLSYEQLDVWWRVILGDTISRDRRIDPPMDGQQPIPPTSLKELEGLCKHLIDFTQIRVHDGRRMFRTKDGNLGLAPPQGKPGDQIWILLGGDVPFVLRPSADNTGEYQFVGECYLHEMMDGQAFDRPGVQLEDIRIQSSLDNNGD
ncbi:uncharacterized protein KY384_006806 [Bacidia gigantensis]|uniref:uncharacterized protein n=1 Tax=Bacidia gigantensis TaxID=2732470 RepID=UPI001D0534C2|nr:uncharacterized protein KY384_006806 [Bacidia gigantensis]KAG8527890.1 hypothetical protein KY384_006806 [Bacidia gigantensis]